MLPNTELNIGIKASLGRTIY